MTPDELAGVCRTISPLEAETASQLPEGVLCRIARGDHKGRPFGTPRNPAMPTTEEFNPRIGVILAGDLAGKIKGRRHGIFPRQAVWVEQLSHEELLRFRIDDPISGQLLSGGFLITGGHHRLNEISRRVQAGELPSDTLVRILFHD